jgi:hypothetical protein
VLGYGECHLPQHHTPHNGQTMWCHSRKNQNISSCAFSTLQSLWNFYD